MFIFNRMGSTSNVVESNPIWTEFEVRSQTPTATAGPEHAWRIFDAYRKSDKMEASVFLFEKRSVEKLHKPKRKEIITDMLRGCARKLEELRHPKILYVISGVKECAETLAFATEPVLASLANVLAYKEQLAASTNQSTNSIPNQQNQNPHQNPGHRPVMIKQYDMLPIEIKYGLLQIIEALTFVHYTCKLIHKNVCPSSIIITKKGTWKLCGLEFIERANSDEPKPCQSWTHRTSKMIQPNLDYIAPEIQQHKCCSVSSDMFSLGMVIASIYNDGRSLIQANHSTSDYIKQLEGLYCQVENILPRVPVPLQEAVSKLLDKNPTARPRAQLLSLIKYFSDPSVHALQFLDVITMKDPNQKAHFYRSTLKEVLTFIPRKLWYQHIWPYLQAESRSQEVFAAVLHPMLYIIQQGTVEDYENIILPSFRELFSAPRSIQGTVILLENLHYVLEKTPRDVAREDMLPMLYQSFDSPNIQILNAAYVAMQNVTEYLQEEGTLRRIALPKLIYAFENTSTDLRILMSALQRILDILDTQQITDEVYPLLWEVKLQEPEVVARVVHIYNVLMSNKKYGLSLHLMATKVMPLLLPVTVNPSLDIDQFTLLIEVLQEMLNRIERSLNQRSKEYISSGSFRRFGGDSQSQINPKFSNRSSKLKLENLSLPSPERNRQPRHRFSTENMHVPPFNIPNVRIDQRKTSSAEDMARKNSIGSKSLAASAENMSRKNSVGAFLGGFGWFGASSSANEGSYLKVSSAFPTRRLSDNTLMTPKIQIASSCVSSPGGTPSGGLPIRRHSSTGPQERRGSNINLSPPTGGGMPITSSSVPYLLSTSLTSIRGSRRPSVSSTSSQQGQGILQHLGTGMCQLFSGRS